MYPLPPPVCRYSQLIYLTLINKHNNLPYLHRDTILVRFFHTFLSSAPHIVIHAYATVIALTSSSPLLDPVTPAILSALGVSILSVLYTTLSFATNDRVSGKNRRIVLPAHLTQILWHLCMIASRVVALVLFGYAFGYYVAAVVGGHWVVMVFLLLLERTTFCADIERQGNGDLKFTRRLCLEIPFDMIAAAVHVFAYFNPKRGRTRVWAGVYHLLMLTENVSMAALFYVYRPSSLSMSSYNSVFSLSALVVVVTLYPIGLVFMLCFYLLYHPKKTGNCYWIGFPRRCCCCSNVEQNEDGPVIGTKYQHRNSRVIISEPTLVSHNGFVPKNLLPVGPNAVAARNQNETSHSLYVSLPNGRISRDRSLTEPEGRQASRAGRQGALQSGSSQQQVVSPIISPDSSRTNTARTVSESNHAASELDTDFSSNAVESNDTVIDTPLFGCTPEAAMASATMLMRTRLISQDMESQRTCTNDTGIDVDSDLQLSPGTVGGDSEDIEGAVGMTSLPAAALEFGDEGNGEMRLPVFVDIPAKQGDYRSALEEHYFPREGAGDTRRDITKAKKSRDLKRQSNRGGSVTPTLPTPTYTPSPTSLTPSSNRVQWRHLNEDSEDVFQGDGSPQRPRREPPPVPQDSSERTRREPPSVPWDSPERPRKSPRSPIGARSHQVTTEEAEPTGSQQDTVPRAATPRSPKGARHLLIQQPSPAPPTVSVQDKVARRLAPPPPRPPRTSSIPNGDQLVQSVHAVSVAVSTEAPQPPRQVLSPSTPPTATTTAPPPFSDGLTRGLSSLVPRTGSERRAQSSSPFPASHRKTAPQGTSVGYSRPLSHNPNTAVGSPARLPRGTSNYSHGSGSESRAPGGSTHSMQYHHAQPRPKSDGWRVDMATAGHVPSQHSRQTYRQGALNSHGSSPERTPYSSTSSDQRFHSVSSANSIDGQMRQSRARYEDAKRRRNTANPATPKSSPYYTTNVPRSAFNRMSPERHRAQHVGAAGGRGLQQPQNYSIPPPSTMSTGMSPSRSPRHYPKAPQGASANAPKLIRSPPKRNIPPPLPPPRMDQASIDEPLTDLNSSSHTRSMGSMSSAANRGSGNYDKLPVEIKDSLSRTPVIGRAENRASFISPGALHPPQSSTHESVV